MSNSNMVEYTKISPHSTNPRRDKIRKITIHHMAGNLSVETCGNVFSGTREASSNYGIDTKGRVGMYVEEKNRAWTSSNAANDNQAVTIEVANDQTGGNWHVSDTALAKLIDLCVDICKRNGIERLNFTGNASGNLTMHKWFAATACPGPYLESKFPYIAAEVNKRLGAAETPEPENPSSGAGTIYKVQTGAFKNKTYAQALEKKLKAAGFDTYVVNTGGYYKVQVGAFSVKANAENMLAKLKKADCSDAFITTESGGAASASVKVGSKVRLKQGAKTYTGGGLASFVYNRDHDVKEISGDRVVITYGGVVVAAVKLADLTLVKE